MTRDELAAHLDYMRELGVQGVSRAAEWRARVETPRPTADLPPGETDDMPSDDALAALPADLPPAVALAPAEALAALRQAIGPACTRCKLHTLGRRQVVFGVGNPQARLMFVGEAPGEDEDKQGEPFVGRAGQLLTKIIEAIGMTREQVYIANVIKCRPPGNRNPEPDEVGTCEPFLFEQLGIIQPRIVVALGLSVVARGLAADGGLVVQREAQLVKPRFLRIALAAEIHQAEHATVEPAVVLRHLHRDATLLVAETRERLVPLALRPALAVQGEQLQRAHDGRIARDRLLRGRCHCRLPRAQGVRLLELVGGKEAVEIRLRCGLPVQRPGAGGIAGELAGARGEIQPARIGALGVGHAPDRGQRGAPVAARHRLAGLPFVQRGVVGRQRHCRQPARGLRQVGGHRPQRDRMQHATTLGVVEAEHAGDARQQRFGAIRRGLREFRQAMRCDQPAARGLRPAVDLRHRRVDEGGVGIRLRRVVAAEAARDGADHRRLAFGRRQLDPLPAQRRRQAALRRQLRERWVAGIGQRLAAAAPQGLRVMRPSLVVASQCTPGLELRATQRGLLDAVVPRGQERRPFLAFRQCCQPVVAEGLGHRLPAMPGQERPAAVGRQRGKLLAQRGVLQPAGQWLAGIRRQRCRVQRAAVGGLEGAAQAGIRHRDQYRWVGGARRRHRCLRAGAAACAQVGQQQAERGQRERVHRRTIAERF